MSKFKEKWNKNNFSIYKSEEKTVLKLIQNIWNFLNDFSTEIDNKTDKNGNHEGSWQGLERPTLSEEGMRATVEKLDDEYTSLVDRMQDIYKISVPNLPSSLKGIIELDKDVIYTVDKLTLEDDTILLCNGATIQCNNEIELKNNCQIHSGVIESKNIILRNESGIITNQSGFGISIRGNGCVIKSCHLKGGIISVSGKSDFLIEGNMIESGYSLGGAISIWDNASNGIIRFNDIMGCNTNAIGIHTSKNIIISHNKLHHCEHSGVWCPYSQYLTIEYNECYNNNHDGLDLNFGADEQYMNFPSHTKVYNNICHNNKATGIYLVGGECIIQNNVIYENYTNGIRTGKWRRDDTTEGENVQIIYNVVKNNNKGGNSSGSTYTHQMLIQDLTGVTIKGNRVLNTANYPNSEYNIYCVISKSVISENFSKDLSGNLSIFSYQDSERHNINKDNIN